MHWIDN